MIILTKENILSYIKEHVPSLQLKEPVKVSMIGEGDLGEDVDGTSCKDRSSVRSGAVSW